MLLWLLHVLNWRAAAVLQAADKEEPAAEEQEAGDKAAAMDVDGPAAEEEAVSSRHNWAGITIACAFITMKLLLLLSFTRSRMLSHLQLALCVMCGVVGSCYMQF
jgi:hypothetical protein